jgi:histone demethylase JARID1
MAESFERRWSHAITPQQKETEYWRILDTGEEYVQVQYGSDLDVANHGSGFPMNENSKEPSVKEQAKLQKKLHVKASEYMLNTGWNTNNLAENTFLHHLNESVAGLTRPMVYVGMLFTTFCWHTEDNYLFSINYMHQGQSKRWYCVPCNYASSFETAMRNFLPDLFSKNPNLLHLLVTQLSPKILMQQGVPVHTALQKAGQFVITFPRAYHAGFNLGYNIAESVNFALENWLPFCNLACNAYRFHRVAAFPYEEFVLQAARNPDSDSISKMLQNEIKDIISKEEQNHSKINQEGITKYISLHNVPYKPCTVCGYDCFISGIVCNVHLGQVACLEHMSMLCDCSAENKRLLVRIHLEELQEIVRNLEKLKLNS